MDRFLRCTGRSDPNRGVRVHCLDRRWSGRRPRVVGIVALATPTAVYRFDRRFDLGSREFESAVSSALATTIVGGDRITRLENGAQYYPEMLAAIAGARRSILPARSLPIPGNSSHRPSHARAAAGAPSVPIVRAAVR
jgi:hypothetical protein